MLELATDLIPLLDAGESVGVVTVTGVPRSAPRGVGASLAVTADGRVIGSISGGCVEGDAVMLATATLASGAASIARFGFSDDTAHAAGLACGGSVDVVVYRVAPDDTNARAALDRAAAGCRADIGITLGRAPGRIVDMSPDRADGAPGESRIHSADGEDVLIVSSAPPPRLIVLGAGEHAAALCRVAHAAGYAVTIADVWDRLVTPERFPDADRLVVGLPHELVATEATDLDERTAICVLTHDERLDVPALRAALALPVGFVGAMGARSTVARRDVLLRQLGVGHEALARLHSPLGLDLGGATPDETAVAILAEIVAVRRGGSARPLRDATGPIHRSDVLDRVERAALSCAV